MGDSKITKEQAQGVGKGAFGYSGTGPSATPRVDIGDGDVPDPEHLAAVARYAQSNGLPLPQSAQESISQMTPAQQSAMNAQVPSGRSGVASGMAQQTGSNGPSGLVGN